jgi:hypothetical protein
MGWFFFGLPRKKSYTNMILPLAPALPFSPDQMVMLEGTSDAAVGHVLGVTSRTVALRRKRAVAGGVEGKRRKLGRVRAATIAAGS